MANRFANAPVSDETNLPADIPSYLSSQGTLADRQDGYMPSESGSSHQYMASSVGGFYLQPKDMNGEIHSWLLFDRPHDSHNFFFFLTMQLLLLQVFVSWTRAAKPTWRPPSTLCSAITKVQSARCCAGTKCTPAIPPRTSQVCEKLKPLLYCGGISSIVVRLIFFSNSQAVSWIRGPSTWTPTAAA